jgi:hypothetical protein
MSIPIANQGTDGVGLRQPPILNIDYYSADVLNNPYSFFDLLRETAPVVYLEPYGVYLTALRGDEDHPERT